ncbi:MAG: sigma-70 family RNA polymerase sigma factor [Clostridia bacterium]|nr:sigma-70 family RNA polymerase sigma factor [Clostridia bacterium]
MNDDELIRLFLKREESAISAAKEKYGAKLRAVARPILPNELDAEECLSDALLDAWNSIPPNEPYGYLFTYLGRLMRCRAIDRVSHDTAKKRAALFTELTDEMESCIPSKESVEGEAEANELARLINGFLGGLPREKRDIFVRRYWFMASIREIAELTGSGESRVKMLLKRLRAQLKQYLIENGYHV